MATKRSRRIRRRKTRRNRRHRKAQKGGAPPLLTPAPLPLPTESIPFEVNIGGVPLTTEGPMLRQEKTETPPTVSWDPAPATLYTIIAWDPDAPSPAAPTAAPWLHWLAINLSGPADSIPAQVSWAAATPPQGVHRYYIGLFKQEQDRISPPTPSQRQNFPLAQFVKQNNLTLLAYKGFRVNASSA
jgi:phosphatidylethanolamine-binding protein (PEBP) family uncharacterized protein